MIFKERAYECYRCGYRTKMLRWDTDPPFYHLYGDSMSDRLMPCGGEMQETGTIADRAPAVVDDTVIGGRWCETIGQEPFFYTSKSQLRAEAERRGYTNVVRHTEEYHAKHRKQHDEELRDTKQIRA